MKKKILSLLGILLAVVLLAGCMSRAFVRYDEMVYERPDLAGIQQLYDTFCQVAGETEDPEEVIEALYDFYDAYDWFYTSYSLADLHYSADLTDIYWEKEYNYCASLTAQVDALLEDMYYVLAKAPSREALEGEDYFGEGFFDDYQGENQWDDTFAELLNRESELQMEYYALSEQALEYGSGSAALYDALGEDMGQILVELIAVRQEMADWWGYEDYCQFADDFYYYRDYTPQQAAELLEQIRLALTELYRKVEQSDVWALSGVPCREKEALAFVRQAAKAMEGTAWDAFRMMEDGGLYDIAYGENKYNSSFEVYLTSYRSPFLFMNPSLTQYDCLVLAHEFGHFTRDYATYGSYIGTDVSEVFSQGMEYLMLCYGEDTEDLAQVKLADSLALYMEQAAFAEFEQKMYGLEGDALSVAGLNALYEDVALRFGFDAVGYDPREYVEITHFYTHPMYIISYVVSNDAAMQLYQMELAQTGTGLQKLEECLVTQEPYFLAFLEEAGLQSPFDPGRIEAVRETFAAVFG